MNTQWFGHTITLNLNSKLDFSFNSQLRRRDFFKSKNIILFRPGFSYEINPKITLAAGYAILNTYVSPSSEQFEHRFWEQITYSSKFKVNNFSGRLRVEQRNSFISDNQDGKAINPYENRYRFQTKWDRKLHINGHKKIYIAAYQEFMISNIKSNTDGPFFDQNRLGASIGCRFNDRVRLELGYIHVYQPIFLTEKVNINHIIALNLSNTFGLKTKP